MSQSLFPSPRRENTLPNGISRESDLLTLRLLYVKRRLVEFAAAVKATFEPVIQTHLYPRSQIDIFIQVLQQDGGEYKIGRFAGRGHRDKSAIGWHISVFQLGEDIVLLHWQGMRMNAGLLRA